MLVASLSFIGGAQSALAAGAPAEAALRNAPFTRTEFLALFRDVDSEADILATKARHLQAATLFKEALQTLEARGAGGALDYDLALAALAFEVVRLTNRAKTTFPRDRREALDLAAQHQSAMARAASRRDLKAQHHRQRGELAVIAARLRLLQDGVFPNAFETQKAIDHFHAAYLVDGETDAAARRFEKDVRRAFVRLQLGRGVFASHSDKTDFQNTLREMKVSTLLPVLRRQYRAHGAGWRPTYLHWLRQGLQMAVDGARAPDAIAFADEMVAAARDSDDSDLLMTARLVRITVAIKFETCQSAHRRLNEIVADIRAHDSHEAKPVWSARALVLRAECMPVTATRSQKYEAALQVLDPLLDKPDVAARAYRMRRDIWRLIEPGRIIGGAGARAAKEADLARVGAALGLSEGELNFAEIVGFGNIEMLQRLADQSSNGGGKD